MTRSAARSRLAPPRFALRATRGSAAREPEGRSVEPGEAPRRRRAFSKQIAADCQPLSVWACPLLRRLRQRGHRLALLPAFDDFRLLFALVSFLPRAAF